MNGELLHAFWACLTFALYFADLEPEASHGSVYGLLCGSNWKFCCAIQMEITYCMCKCVVELISLQHFSSV